jgi:hypothetical protein
MKHRASHKTLKTHLVTPKIEHATTKKSKREKNSSTIFGTQTATVAFQPAAIDFQKLVAEPGMGGIILASNST